MHSDKDCSEINAFSTVFPDAKHQLCYWHVLRAIKQHLVVLQHQCYQYIHVTLSSYVTCAKLSSQGRFWCWLGLVESRPVARNTCKTALANRIESSFFFRHH